jgi:hypothetical protein
VWECSSSASLLLVVVVVVVVSLSLVGYMEEYRARFAWLPVRKEERRPIDQTDDD